MLIIKVTLPDNLYLFEILVCTSVITLCVIPTLMQRWRIKCSDFTADRGWREANKEATEPLHGLVSTGEEKVERQNARCADVKMPGVGKMLKLGDVLCSATISEWLSEDSWPTIWFTVLYRMFNYHQWTTILRFVIYYLIHSFVLFAYVCNDQSCTWQKSPACLVVSGAISPLWKSCPSWKVALMFMGFQGACLMLKATS